MPKSEGSRKLRSGSKRCPQNSEKMAALILRVPYSHKGKVSIGRGTLPGVQSTLGEDQKKGEEGLLPSVAFVIHNVRMYICIINV